MKIVTLAEVPDELGQAWLQHLRDFDVAHEGCHFDVLSMGWLGTDEVREILHGIQPPLPFTRVMKDPK